MGELVAKAFATVEMGVEIIISSEEQQDRWNQEYKARIEKNKLSDPRMVKDENRVDNVTQWPSVTLGDIFEYILRLKYFECDYVGKYMDQRVYSYFDSGFVDDITFYQYSEEIKYMYCKVLSSMTVTDHKNLWIAIKVTGLSLLPGVRVWPVQANVPPTDLQIQLAPQGTTREQRRRSGGQRSIAAKNDAVVRPTRICSSN